MERLTGLPPARFMLRFESLGDNCEFGLVQRRCRAEPLGLLRFANMSVFDMLRGIETRFQGFGEERNLEASLSSAARREHVIREKAFSFVYHTFQYEGEANEDDLLRRNSVRLKFLARKFVDDLQTGDKMLIFKRNQSPTEQEILPLLLALNWQGNNTLLYVVIADQDHVAGSVDYVMPNLLRAYIDRLAPYDDAHNLSFEVWLDICVNAARLLDARTRTGPAVDAPPAAGEPDPAAMARRV